jgi:hypothetical protein
VGVFLGALRDGATLRLHPAPRLLHDAPAGRHLLALALHLIAESAVHGAEAVHVLDFYLAQELLAAQRPDADVGVAAELALLHVGRGYPQVEEDLAQLDQVLAGLLR